MSILINGMDMPKNCAGCDLSYYRDGYNGGYGYGPSGYWCGALKRLIEKDKKRRDYYPRPSDCPLSEIPTPHGDLIDRDDLLAYFDRKAKGKTAEEALKLLYTALKAYPTVIEKEGES